MIMVDELKDYLPAPGRMSGRWCHLTTDGNLEDLHEFAQGIGLKREWFQDHPRVPHYDLRPSKRARALEAGAVFVSAREQALRRRARRVEEGDGHDA